MEPRLSPSAYAMLGFLAFGEASGYDLRRVAADTVANFWAAADSQIYPALTQLEAAGLVTSTDQPGSRGRQVYRITPEGERALDDWLRQPARAPAFRHPAMIRLFFGWRLPAADLRLLIDRRRDQLREQLSGIERQRADANGMLAALPEGSDVARKAAFGALIIDGGVEITAAELRWWDTVAERLLPAANH
ncbi:MAG: PadR family transcriptional regulator [Nocardioides sp.]|uniref:PadR family transcriptional regulator n=1 Tax=Nocardioides sp. TaxID=35761 RepID=UPI0039E62271